MLLIWLTELWSLNRAFLKTQRVSELKLEAAQKPVHSAGSALLSIKSPVVFTFPGSVTRHVFWRIPAEGLESLKGRQNSFPLMSPSLAPSIFLNDLRTFCWCSACVRTETFPFHKPSAYDFHLVFPKHHLWLFLSYICTALGSTQGCFQSRVSSIEPTLTTEIWPELSWKKTCK